MAEKLYNKIHPRKVFYDHHGSNDDYVGLLLLLASENIDLLGVTVTPAGCLLADGIEATVKILDFCGKTTVPVGEGRHQGRNPFPYDVRASPKVICALPQLIHLALNKRQLQNEAAEDLMIRRIKETKDQVSVVLAGPPTNFVKALEKAPEIKERIEEVVVMGGAIEVGGNVFQYNHDASAEWNFFWDPESSKKLISSGLKLTIFPLDIANNLPTDLTLLKQLAKQRKFEFSDLACQIWAPTLVVQNGKFGHLMCDVLASAYLTCDNLAAFKRLELDVIASPPSEGKLFKSPGSNYWVNVAQEIHLDNYRDYYLKVLQKNAKNIDLSQHNAIKNRKVYYDHDGNIDDIISLQTILSMPNIDLIGIGVTPADCFLEDGIRSTLRMLSLYGKTKIPVAKGTLYGSNPFPERWRALGKTITGMPLMINQKIYPEQVVKESSEELIVKLLKESKEPVTILLTGPSTNLAAALKKAPEIKEKIEEVVLMAGAVDVRGNVFQYNHDATAEWNVYNDPQATQDVFRSGLKITIFSLDSTNNVPVNMDFLKKLADQREYSASYLASQLWSPTVRTIPALDYVYYMWDTLATAYLGCEKLCTFRNLELDVKTDGPSEGKTFKSTGSGYFVNVADNVNVDGFFKFYFKQLQQQLRIEEDE